MAPNVFLISMHFEQSNIRMAYTQMIGTKDFVSRPRI